VKLESAKRQLGADREEAYRREVDVGQSLMNAAASAASALHESAQSLAESQGHVARVTADAVKQIAEVS